MPLRIEENISEERTKLDELQAELRMHDLQASHIQHSIDHGPENEDELGDEEGSDILDVDNPSLGEDSGEAVE